jgi:hypothetical protein
LAPEPCPSYWRATPNPTQDPSKPLETYKTYEKYDNSLHVSFEIREQNITGYDKKFDGKNKTTSK